MPVRNMSSEEGQPQVRVVRDLEELSRYASQWNDLASKAPQCMPTSSYAWVSAYFEHRVGDEERWVVLLAVDEGTLVGVLPLIASPHLVVGMTCPILHTPYDSQIAACDVVLAAGREQEVFELLFKAATELFPRRVSIEIREIPSTSATLHVADVVEASLIKEFARPGSFLPIEGSFEDYRASIRPELRRNLKKAHNRFNKLDRVEFEILAGESAIEAELDRFASVEAASWKGAEGGAIVRSQSLVDFYTTLTRRLSEAGWLHWGFLSVGDKDIAASLTVKLQRKLFMWKSGYDDEYRNLSPFNVLFEHVVRQAHSSSEVDEIDGFSDVAWLDRWQASKRDYFNLAWYPRHPISLVLGYWPSRLRIFLRRSPLLARWAGNLQRLWAAVSKTLKKGRGRTP
jgi:CelD/BcsL family acetyltransferase involved in cellulose biosynthesis